MTASGLGTLCARLGDRSLGAHAMEKQIAVFLFFVSAAAIDCGSPVAPVPPFSLAGGSYAYTLTLTPVDSCTYSFSPPEIAFAGMLQVTGHAWDFMLPQVQKLDGHPDEAGLHLRVDTTVALISGTIGGGFSLEQQKRVGVAVWSSSARVNPETPFRGILNANGILAGSFEGYVELEVNETGDRGSCASLLFAGTLAPAK